MLQIFLQPSKISSPEWEVAYQNIKSIVENFPTKIVRLESYKKYEKKLDKLHFDLILEENTPNEHISIWGDWMSYTGRLTVRFYKDWSKQQELQSFGKEVDASKSVTFYTNIPYKNDGDIPKANGVNLYYYHVIDTEGAHYESALIAIGIMLENLFPNAAFLTVLLEENIKEIEAVKEWLEGHFNKPFDMPLYFDKLRLLKLLKQDYSNNKEIICRLAHLYRKKHKKNMELAVKYIGYEPAFQFYTEVLADTSFGTFGFADILDPWIAATQDLESTLNLVAASRNLLLQKTDEESAKEEADKYDLTYVLEKLLNNHILLSPVERENLQLFHTNQQALEEGSEDLFGTIGRIMGYRIDICPIYADKEELFEAFMYHDPKNGMTFKKIIDDWIAENSEKYSELKQKIDETIEEFEQKKFNDTLEGKTYIEEIREVELRRNFLKNFSPYEKYFVEKAINKNPYYLKVDYAINSFKKRAIKCIKEYSNQDYVEEVRSLPKDIHIKFIKKRIHEVGYEVHPNFEEWLEAVDDDNVLLHLHIALALNIHDRNSHYSRFRLLWDKNNWKDWIEINDASSE